MRCSSATDHLRLLAELKKPSQPDSCPHGRVRGELFDMLGEAVVQYPFVAVDPFRWKLHVPGLHNRVEELEWDDFLAEDVVDHFFGVQLRTEGAFEFVGYPRKTGHFIASITEGDSRLPLARSG